MVWTVSLSCPSLAGVLITIRLNHETVEYLFTMSLVLWKIALYLIQLVFFTFKAVQNANINHLEVDDTCRPRMINDAEPLGSNKIL